MEMTVWSLKSHLSKLSNRVVPQVVEPKALQARSCSQRPPCGTPALHRYLWLDVAVLTSWEHMVRRLHIRQALCPRSDLQKYIVGRLI